MKNFTLSLFCILLIFTGHTQAICGFDKIHQAKLDTDPAFAKMIEANNASMRKYIDTHVFNSPGSRVDAAIYTIPVVVHVMHTGGIIGSTYNPTDAQIQGAINYLNQVFAGTHASLIPPQGMASVTDIQIQFALAQRTPTCGATNGIDRIDASAIPNYAANGVRAATTTGCTDLELKNFARWNPADYYNIYVVNKIDGADGTAGQFIAGYASFAGGSPALDGTVMLATQMADGEKTLPHEIGHALNVYHTFQGSTLAPNCPANANCATDGDRVCDTDPIYHNINGAGVINFTCRSGTNNCPSPSAPYNVNTESNFMSYTNCYKVFTLDQKSRMLAAMSLAGRASLVAPGNLSLVPCGTTINFAQTGSSTTESITGTTVGCRTYRDYTYNMAIGAAATADATVTLSFSGSATAGLDYDITTNGNFASPSNTLVFPGGTTNAQSFTVRVYNDAEPEPAENLVIDFTVNNGGGNASKGTHAPTFTLTITDNEIAPIAPFTGTLQIGTPDDDQGAAPFDATLQSQRGQYLYRADELNAAGITAGTINSFGLSVLQKLSTRPFVNFTIKMGQTSLTNLVNGSVTVVGGLSTVYTSAAYSTTAGWNDFTLSAPFNWNGTSSIVVEICFDNGTANAASGADLVNIYADGSSSTAGNMFFQNGINCAGSFGSVSYFPYGFKPTLRLGVAIAGTPVETVLNASSTQYIGVGSSDYFYSATGNLIAKLAGISANLGCVTSQLEGAGTSWLSYSGGQRSAKVFGITPTQNGPTASYTLSLYFNTAELDGKNPSALKIAKTTAATIAGANGSNPILLTPTVTTLGTGITIFTASFTGFSHFFLVDNAVTLPVGLVEFKGKLTNEKNSLLQWSTSFEKNNKQFEIELSRDGNNFVQLDQVKSKGDAALGNAYNYLHARPARGMNYYRLKQVDIDGRSSYSNVISILVDGQHDPRPFVSPNPASESIKINFVQATTQAIQLEILGSDLKLVGRETVAAGIINHPLTIGKLPAGAYFIRMVIAGKTEVLRFVKE